MQCIQSFAKQTFEGGFNAAIQPLPLLQGFGTNFNLYFMGCLSELLKTNLDRRIFDRQPLTLQPIQIPVSHFLDQRLTQARRHHIKGGSVMAQYGNRFFSSRTQYLCRVLLELGHANRIISQESGRLAAGRRRLTKVPETQHCQK